MAMNYMQFSCRLTAAQKAAYNKGGIPLGGACKALCLRSREAYKQRDYLTAESLLRAAEQLAIKHAEVI